ncbi:MAG: hypothetical protein ACI9FU_001369 [Granulosicoccus sp.]|jgi:hypothetical protein
MRQIGYILLAVVLGFGACKKTENINPYVGVGVPPPFGGDSLDIEDWNIVALQRDVFKPTCANSGCHDGTFEPDFRNVESTYNTLVNHPVIKNNPAETFEDRVVPGSLSQSMLWLRLNEDIDGQSGIMPLIVDPDNDWQETNSTHLNNIRMWIENGALDMFGNPAPSGDHQPGFHGVYAEADGIPCDLAGRIRVPVGSQNVTVWVSISDNETSLDQFSYNKVRMGTNVLYNYDTVSTEMNLNYDPTPITKPGMFGGNVEYYHSFTFSTASWNPELSHYFRVYVKDPLQEENTEMPQDGSAIHIKKFFSWKIDS